MAQLLQRCHRDGHAGCGHNRADKQCAEEFRAADCRKAVECAVEQRAAHQRYKHTDAGNQRGNRPGPHQFFQVGAKSCGKHQQHNTDFSKNGDRVVDLHQIEQTGPNQQTGENFTDHLRGLALAGNQAKKLGAQNNNCQITEDGIHTCHLSQFTVIHPCYSTSARFFQ